MSGSRSISARPVDRNPATPFPSTKTTDGKGPTPYIVTPNGFSFPKSVIPHSQGGSLETHLRRSQSHGVPPNRSRSNHPGDDDGDVHLTTFDGLLYNFQAVGEFVLAKSTAPGELVPGADPNCAVAPGCQSHR